LKKAISVIVGGNILWLTTIPSRDTVYWFEGSSYVYVEDPAGMLQLSKGSTPPPRLSVRIRRDMFSGDKTIGPRNTTTTGATPVRIRKIVFTLENYSEVGAGAQLVMKRFCPGITIITGEGQNTSSVFSDSQYREANNYAGETGVPSRFPFTTQTITPDLKLEAHFADHRIDETWVEKIRQTYEFSEDFKIVHPRGVSRRKNNNLKRLLSSPGELFERNFNERATSWNYFSFHVLTAAGALSPELARIKVTSRKVEIGSTDEWAVVLTPKIC
jgi:hypothetical protein